MPKACVLTPLQQAELVLIGAIKAKAHRQVLDRLAVELMEAAAEEGRARLKAEDLQSSQN